MRFRVQANTFVEALKSASTVVDRDSRVPILANVRIRSAMQTAAITGTDLDDMLTRKLQVNGFRTGAAVVNPKPMIAFCKMLGDEEVEVSQVGPGVRVKQGKTVLDVDTINTSNWPAIVTKVKGPSLTLGTEELLSAIKKIECSVIKKDSRYALAVNAMLLEVSQKQTRIASTDGHRLSLVDLKQCELNGYKARQLLIRSEILSVLLREFRSYPKIKMISDKKRVMFQAGELTLVSRLAQGKFPDYNVVIPQENRIITTVKTSEVERAVKLAKVGADRESNGLVFEFSKGKLKVRSYNEDGAKVASTIKAAYGDEPLTIGFDGEYVQDFLENTDSEEVAFHLRDPGFQVLAKPVPDSGYTYVLMPMKL